MRAAGGRPLGESGMFPGLKGLAQDAVIVTDADHCITALNPAAEALTAWSGAAAAGVPLAALLRPEGGGTTLVDGRCTVHTRDGRVHTAHAITTPIIDSAGRRLGAVTLLNARAQPPCAPAAQPQLDLAAPELGLAIDALGAGMRERAEEVTALMNVIPVALYIAHDADCISVTSNHAAERLLSPPQPTDPAEASPYAHRVFQNGVELGPHEMPIQRAAALGIPTNGAEYEIRFDDGNSKYIYGYATPLFEANGRTRGAVAAFIDVTERRHNENALRESEQRFRVLADNVPVMIWVADHEGNVTYLNKTWRQFTGRHREHMGAGWLEGVHPTDCERVKAEFRRHIDERATFALEMRLRRADGSYAWITDTATPLYLEGGEFAGYIGTCADITLTKLHEQHLEQADRRKDEFIATLAHELRNPLAPIRNALTILRSDDADHHGMRWAREVIERQVTQLVRLVDDLLDVARVACGHLELRRETIPVDSIIHDAIEASRPLLERGRHQLHVSLSAQTPYVHGDRTRLAEILINLLNNAAKYTPDGGEVWVICEHGDSRAVVRVRDNGIGIAPDALPGIFSMFTQLDSSLDRAQGGLGVGLALARKLAQLHDGALDAYSAGPGQGSEFVLTLPAVNAGPAEAPALAGAAVAPAAGALRVLVVDDSEDAAESLAMLLRLNGHAVDTAHEATSALRRLSEFRPEIVILDIELPGMSGYDLAQHIRRLPGGTDLTLIALTGRGRREERAQAFRSGFDHHLTKPVSVEELQQALAAHAH